MPTENVAHYRLKKCRYICGIYDLSTFVRKLATHNNVTRTR